MKSNNQKDNPDIDYPCRWTYKVIGFDEDLLRRTIAGILTDQPYRITVSHSSKTGKYICLNLLTEVSNEKNRIATYEALRNHPAVKIVL
jgi:putative lipoic acid-binding regulatory protein